jgi:hypothetical protein
MNSVFVNMINGAILGIGIWGIINLLNRWKAKKIELLFAFIGCAVIFLSIICSNLILNYVTKKSEYAGIMDEVRQQPLIGEATRRFPEADAILKETVRKIEGLNVEEAIKTATQAGKTIRERFIIPALRNASDISINNVFDAKREFISFSHDSNLESCGHIIKNGVLNPLKLEGTAKLLFNTATELEERAMISGIETISPPIKRSMDDIKGLFSKLQLSVSEFTTISDMGNASDRDACIATNALYKAISILPNEEKAVLGRFLLSDGL